MAREQIEAALKVAEARQEDGWQVLPEGRSLTLYVAKDGASLNVSRVEALTFDDALLRARTTSGEVFVVSTADVFAAAAAGGSVARSKKAGFI
jgi:hypothetical protein